MLRTASACLWLSRFSKLLPRWPSSVKVLIIIMATLCLPPLPLSTPKQYYGAHHRHCLPGGQKSNFMFLSFLKGCSSNSELNALAISLFFFVILH